LIPLAAATGVVMATSLLVLVASAAAPAAIEATLAAAGIGHKPFGHKPYYRTPVHRQPAMREWGLGVDLPAAEPLGAILRSR
jgi:hypothetical protein